MDRAGAWTGSTLTRAGKNAILWVSSTVGRASAWASACAGVSQVRSLLEIAASPSKQSSGTRGHFPDEQAATKLIYLAIDRAETKWRSARAWTAARRALKIHFEDRYPG
jgi:hypothetical protein